MWEQRRAEANERRRNERRVKAIQQKLDRLDEAFLYAQSIDITTYEPATGQAARGADARPDRPPRRGRRGIRRGGHPGVRRTRFAARRGPVGAGVARYKQRLQQLFFPDGIAFDGNRFNRTAVTAPFFKYLAPSESADEKVVSRDRNRTARQSNRRALIARKQRGRKPKHPKQLVAPGHRNDHAAGRQSYR